MRVFSSRASSFVAVVIVSPSRAVAAIVASRASDAVAAALAAKEAELAQTKQRLTEIARPRKKVDAGEIIAALELIGGAVAALARATDAERRDLYDALDLRIRYDATKKRAHYTVSPLLSATRVDSRVWAKTDR